MRIENDVWMLPAEVRWTDVEGYPIEALDGGIGKIDEATYESTGGFLVVDTGPWIFGKKVMLPAGVIDHIDHDTETVFVNRTKDQIKDAPEFDPDSYRDDSYRGELGTYYGKGGAGYKAHRDELI
ncbi:MAG TPA: hypothetical protein VK874_03030 [Gaiellaceae bacterium]|nr:hypothetical protein [Gaiellaceae bacterium]